MKQTMPTQETPPPPPPLLDSLELREKATPAPHQPPPTPVRQWDNNLFHNVPGVPVPAPTADHTAPSVAIQVLGTGTRPKVYERYQPNRRSHRQYQNYQDDNDNSQLESGRDSKLQRLQERNPEAELRGAPTPDVVFLYITACDIQTTSEEVELHIFKHFEQVTDVRARATRRINHDYYASFTVTIKGNDLNLDDFLDADVFPSPIKVFPNRNKYPDADERYL